MDGLNQIIAQLEKQKLAIEKALGALQEAGGGTSAAPAKRAYTRRAGKGKKHGGISAEGRKRLADAMRRRWAVKRAGSTVKKAAKKA